MLPFFCARAGPQLKGFFMEDHRSMQQDDTTIYLIGGGIASLAAAAFLIRDADTSAPMTCSHQFRR